MLPRCIFRKAFLREQLAQAGFQQDSEPQQKHKIFRLHPPKALAGKPESQKLPFLVSSIFMVAYNLKKRSNRIGPS